MKEPESEGLQVLTWKEILKTALVLVAVPTMLIAQSTIMYWQHAELQESRAHKSYLEDVLANRAIENIDYKLDIEACEDILNSVLENDTKGECYEEARRDENIGTQEQL